VAADVLRHRITLSDEALATNVRLDALVQDLVAAVPAPALSLN
jgi:hypothetical protein